MSTTVGVIGLGQMGGAIAANLIKNGFTVSGFDPVDAMRDRLAANGGRPLDSVGAVAGAAEVLVISLPSPQALADVAAEVASVTKSGQVAMEVSTLTIDDKQAAHDTMAAAGVTLLDIPMSGTGVQARSGDLVYFASGDEAAYATAKPVLEGFCRDGYHVGGFGDGSRMKFVANLLVAIHNVAAGEAMTLARKAGLDPQQTLDVIGASAATSRMLEVRGPTMVSGDYAGGGIALRLFQKDMSIIGGFTKELGVAAPLFQTSAGIYDRAINEGHEEDDTASVCAVLERMAGIKR